eukprot:c7751_g1_i1.p1 GENE.c7751_g1_i1~~c7751_g1_i1.p1  ORF type:complete len:160 (+),score=47.13 c7751_g1_i1:139-618(+)
MPPKVIRRVSFFAGEDAHPSIQGNTINFGLLIKSHVYRLVCDVQLEPFTLFEVDQEVDNVPSRSSNTQLSVTFPPNSSIEIQQASPGRLTIEVTTSMLGDFHFDVTVNDHTLSVIGKSMSRDMGTPALRSGVRRTRSGIENEPISESEFGKAKLVDDTE